MLLLLLLVTVLLFFYDCSDAATGAAFKFVCGLRAGYYKCI